MKRPGPSQLLNVTKTATRVSFFSLTIASLILTYTHFTANPEFECFGPDELNYVHRTVSPYLYPFIIEFNILIVGIWYMIWANISHCPKKLSAPGHGHSTEQADHSDENNNESIEAGNGKSIGKFCDSKIQRQSDCVHFGIFFFLV